MVAPHTSPLARDVKTHSCVSKILADSCLTAPILRHWAKQSLSEAQRPSARDRPESSRKLAGFRETCSQSGSGLWKRELRSDLGLSGELLMARSAEWSDGLQYHK